MPRPEYQALLRKSTASSAAPPSTARDRPEGSADTAPSRWVQAPPPRQHQVAASSVSISGVTGGGDVKAAPVPHRQRNLSIDSPLDNLSTSRANWGAVQNRFSSVVSTLSGRLGERERLRGRIMDADFAKETANMTRAQILQQAGTAMVSPGQQHAQQRAVLLQLIQAWQPPTGAASTRMWRPRWGNNRMSIQSVSASTSQYAPAVPDRFGQGCTEGRRLSRSLPGSRPAGRRQADKAAQPAEQRSSSTRPSSRSRTSSQRQPTAWVLHRRRSGVPVVRWWIPSQEVDPADPVRRSPEDRQDPRLPARPAGKSSRPEPTKCLPD